MSVRCHVCGSEYTLNCEECSDKQIADLEAKNKRLRAALELIEAKAVFDTDAWAAEIARAALDEDKT